MSDCDKNKKKILLHTICPQKKNGPNSVNDCIKQSDLLKKCFEIECLDQDILPGKNPIKFLRLIQLLKSKINSSHADAVAVTGLQFAGFCATFAAYLSNAKKIIVCIHGHSGDANNISGFEKFLFNHIVEPLTLKMADCVYTVCNCGANHKIVQKYANKKIYGTIHNCIPKISEPVKPGFRKEFEIDHAEIVITIVSRVVYDKGHQDVIDALQKGLPDNARLIVVGEGPYIEKYQSSCADLMKNKKIILTGQRNDVLDILSESDIFLFPSYHENLSMALLEACYSNCAVIATNVGGNIEVIQDKVNGILIPAHDADAIYNSIFELSKNCKLIGEYADAAFKTVQEEFSYEVFEKRMDCLYKHVLGVNHENEEKV